MTHSNATGSPPESSTESQIMRKYRQRAIAAAGIGWGLDGFTWTMYGFALVAAMPVLGLTSADTGWVTAISIVASAIGGIIFGNLADRFGRVRMLSVVIFGYAIFTALTATSQNGWQFLLWRTLEGLFFGGEWAVGAALVAEYARPERRGRILALIQSCYAIGWAGSTLAYLVIFSYFPPETAWRYLFLIGVLPAAFAFIIRATTKDVTEVTPEDGAISPTLVKGLKETHNAESKNMRELFNSDLRKRTIMAVLLGVGVQMIYYSVFIFLPTYLQQERGLSIVGTATYTWGAIVGSFIGYVASGFLLDSIGRKKTFAFFFAGAAASVALFVYTPAAQDVAGILIIIFLGFFASGPAGGTGAYLAELFPTHIRATGQAVAYNTGRAIAAFGPLTIGYAAASIGWGNSILVIAIIGTVIGLFALSQLPETRNAQLVESIE